MQRPTARGRQAHDDMCFGRPFRILVALLLALGGMIAGARPAWAHANLLSTDPEYGATPNDAPGRVVIRYDLPVEINGAQVKLDRSGQAVRPGRPGYASADHKDVAVPLPKLEPGKYVLTWFLFGSDGDVMGGELAFAVLGGNVPATGVELCFKENALCSAVLFEAVGVPPVKVISTLVFLPTLLPVGA